VAALAVLAGVLLVHMGLLGGWSAPGTGVRPAPPLQVRQIRPAPVLAPVAEAPATAPAAAARPAPATRSSAAARAASAAAPPQADADGTPPPVYATRLPPPLTLHYEIGAGDAPRPATLQWAPGADGYTLQLLEAGPTAAGRHSQGTLDAHGVAPERYTESRRGRELRAANFRRDAGVISFSGPAQQHALLPGAQDRLSWIVQLAGILGANPALATPGATLQMLVAGTRGDAEVWDFTAQGFEAVDQPEGSSTRALKLQREPRRLYDTQVQVWVDPAQHWLPQRLRLTLRASGQAIEWRLRAAAPP